MHKVIKKIITISCIGTAPRSAELGVMFKKPSTIYKLKMKADTFWYNFRWSDWIDYIDGWIPRFAFFVPLLGYLILFNDKIGELVQFNTLVGSNSILDGLDSGERLRLIYFGLIFLGISNIIFRLKKPYIFRFGTNIREYTSNCLQTLSFDSFLRMHQGIREDGHFTQSGKYYDSEWDGFQKIAIDEDEGTDKVKYNGNWEEAKSRYGSLLRSILNEHFFKKDIARRGWLSFCVALSTIGYILLIIPSLELFSKVIYSSFIL